MYPYLSLSFFLLLYAISLLRKHLSLFFLFLAGTGFNADLNIVAEKLAQINRPSLVSVEVAGWVFSRDPLCRHVNILNV